MLNRNAINKENTQLQKLNYFIFWELDNNGTLPF